MRIVESVVALRITWLFVTSLATSSAFANGIIWPMGCDVNLKKLLKLPQATDIVLSDLTDVFPTIQMSLPKVHISSNEHERFAALANFPIESIIAAPGHKVLRNPAQVEGLTKYIRENNGGNFEHDKLLINLITNAEGQVISVDLWNAHHRMVAYLEAGYKFIGDLNPKNVEVLVNGKKVNGEQWTHFLSIAGIDEDRFGGSHVVPPGGDIRVGTVKVAGDVSNHDLGSRFTIRQLRENTMDPDRKHKVGVYFGTFDPIHEEHMLLIKQAIAEQGLDEVIVVPNFNSINKPNASAPQHRIGMVAERIRHEPKVNLYTGDSSKIIDRFGRDPFIERISQIYGSKNVYQIIGQDSFEKLLREGKISGKMNRKYIVFKRAGEGVVPQVPSEAQSKVHISPSNDNTGLSSTKIRNALYSGQEVPTQELDPAVLKYIKDHGLYGSASSPPPVPAQSP